MLLHLENQYRQGDGRVSEVVHRRFHFPADLDSHHELTTASCTHQYQIFHSPNALQDSYLAKSTRILRCSVTSITFRKDLPLRSREGLPFSSLLTRL
jgi:hypothetical protein